MYFVHPKIKITSRVKAKYSRYMHYTFTSMKPSCSTVNIIKTNTLSRYLLSFYIVS